MKQSQLFLTGLLTIISSMISLPGLLADELRLPSSSLQSISMELPARGSTMSHVEEHFGEPQLKKDAIGNPPITVWEYKDYSVYFEQHYVIHSVFISAGPIIVTESENSNLNLLPEY